MAAAALTMVEDGAAIVGGCCGTTPDHLANMAQAAGLRPGDSGSVDVDVLAMLR
jgi:hypothetical protein